MTSNLKELTGLIRDVRALFQDLKAFSDRLYAPLGINASQRSVLEFLTENGPNTVPDIARVKNVTRQHIQKIVDQLVLSGFVEAQENPEHKRSYIIALTSRGEMAFEIIAEREREILQALAGDHRGADLRTARHSLQKISHQLKEVPEND